MIRQFLIKLQVDGSTNLAVPLTYNITTYFHVGWFRTATV